MTRPAKTALALGKIDLEEKTTDLRLKLKGKLAVDLADYQRAFAQANDQSLELDQLVPFARWCPPWDKAFDTRFYLTDLGTGAVSIAEDGDESTRLYWASAAETLRMIAAGEVTAIFPTICNLQRLATFADFAAATAQARALPPRLIEPWSETEGGVEYLCIPADAGYPQPRHRMDQMRRGAP